MVMPLPFAGHVDPYPAVSGSLYYIAREFIKVSHRSGALLFLRSKIEIDIKSYVTLRFLIFQFGAILFKHTIKSASALSRLVEVGI